MTENRDWKVIQKIDPWAYSSIECEQCGIKSRPGTVGWMPKTVVYIITNGEKKKCVMTASITVLTFISEFC